MAMPVRMIRMTMECMILARTSRRIARFGLVRGPRAGMMRLVAHALMK